MHKGKWSPWTAVKSAMRIAVRIFPVIAQIMAWECDAVFSNTITVCSGAFAAAILRLPHVWHFHELGYEDHRLVFDFGERFSGRTLNLLSTASIANSHVVANKFGHYMSSTPLRIIYYSMHRTNENGDKLLCEEVRTPPNMGRLRCVLVGTLFEAKGQEDAIRAIAELLTRGVDAELLLVGGGKEADYRHLQEIVAAKNLRDRVTFIGTVRNPRPFVESADIVLMCSRCEAFGRVTVEGMLAGKPVIATRSGANLELIQEGFNGLLYTVADYNDLSEKIRYLYENPGLAESMGNNGREWAQMIFTKERYGTELLAVLSAVCRAASTA
jgi:glycosyltransferase involved in cell wall biosynthesis